MENEPYCHSCQTPLINHLGLAGTCAKLRAAEAEIAVLRKALDEAEKTIASMLAKATKKFMSSTT